MAHFEIAPNFGLRGFRRGLVIGVAGFALTTYFLLAGFPYDRLAPRLAAALETATGARVMIGGLDLRMHWFAPQVRAKDVSIRWPESRALTFDKVRIHPVVSRSWLRGAPALQVALRSPLGEAEGVVVAGAAPSFDGDVHGVSLALLPLDDVAPGVHLDGLADAQIDLQMAESGPQGSVHIEAKSGSLSVPSLPVGVPFDKLSADLELGGDQLAKLVSLDLAGPLVALTGSGTLGQGATPSLSPLALQARLEAREPAMRSMLQSQGLALDASGGVSVTVDGTLGDPKVTPAPPGGRAR